MAKEIFLLVGDCYKSITFTPELGKTDSECLREAMLLASFKDIELQNRMLGCTVNFLRERVKKSKEVVLVQIDEDEEIEDESNIQPHFKPVHQMILTPGIPGEDLQTDTSTSGKGSSELDGNVPMQEFLICNSTPNVTLLADMSTTDNAMESNEVEAIEAVVDPIAEKTAGKKRLRHQVSSKKKKGNSGDRPAIEKITLPPLSSKLQELMGKAHLCTPTFVAFYVSWLRGVKKDKILPREYRGLAAAIVERHPELKFDDDYPEGIVHPMLSMHARNARRLEKKQRMEVLGLQENNEESLATKKKKSNPMLLPTASPDDSIETAAEEAHMLKMMEQLRKHASSVGVTSENAKRLVRETFKKRRQWIENVPVDSGPNFIVEEFPHFLNVDLILLELSLMKNCDMKVMEEKMTETVLDVAKFKNIPCESEEEKGNFLAKLYQSCKPKNTGKDVPDCVDIKQAHNPLNQDLVSKKNEGARLVLYYDLDEKDNIQLVVAYVIADEKIKIKIPEPTVVKCLLCLLGCYHIWDKTYPSAYKCFLNIFDVFGLETKTTDMNVVFKAFKRDFSKWKKEMKESNNELN